MWCVNIFTPCGLSFPSLNGVLTDKTFLIWWILIYWPFSFWIVLRTLCQIQALKDFLWCLQNFVVLYFTFGPMIQFELIFGYCWGRDWGPFLFVCFHMDVQLFHLYFPIQCLCISSKISWSYLCEYISRHFMLLHWSTCLSFHQYHLVLITVALQ